MSKKLETAFKTLLTEQQIINPSYTHYGGLTGFQDYGIIGSRIKQNLITVWRKHWLSSANKIDEVEVPDIAPYAVLKASGHVDKFSDQIVELNGTEIRADHLAKEIYKHLNLDEDAVDSLSVTELEKVINDNLQYVIQTYSKASKDTQTHTTQATPATPVTPATPTTPTTPTTPATPTTQAVKSLKVRTKSLMLGINDGSMYLMRPELAQTIYPNFSRYYDYHHNKLPFGIAQIGRSYRNEISPKPFERLRSFTQAEIEYFYDPTFPVHPEYSTVSSLKIPLLSAVSQLNGLKACEQNLGDAVSQGIISDQITATFIGKVFLFALDIGLKLNLIRFRQHLSSEMAHYAKDCWDLECFVNNEKWLECVGIANRGDYDLKVHDRNNSFRIDRERVHKTKLELDREYIGKTFKSKAKEITTKFNELVEIATTHQEVAGSKLVSTDEHLESLKKVNNVALKLDDGSDILIDASHIREKHCVVQESFYPHIIEPSFGIDRLFYAVLSQNYWIRADETVDTPKVEKSVILSPTDKNLKTVDNTTEVSFDDLRQVLSLRPCLSPYDVSVLYLVNNPAIMKVAEDITTELLQNNFKIYSGTGSGSVGKKYVRTDRIGIPFVLTVDYDSLTDNKVTIRNRDDMTQVRVDIPSLTTVLKGLLKN